MASNDSKVLKALGTVRAAMNQGYELTEHERSILGDIVTKAMEDRQETTIETVDPERLMGTLRLAHDALMPYAGQDIEVLSLMAGIKGLLTVCGPGAELNRAIRMQIDNTLLRADSMLARLQEKRE